MPSFKYDDTPRKPYEEPGEYQVKVETAEWQTARGSGNTMIKLQLRTIPGGAVVFDNLVFVDKAFWKVSSAFAAFFPSKGIKAPAKDENVDYEERQDWLDEHLVGATGWALLSKGTSTSGKLRNEVEAYLLPKKGDKPVSGPTTKPTPAVATSASATKTKTKEAPKSTFPKSDDDDEIPF
jgi:hypothetical protein